MSKCYCPKCRELTNHISLHKKQIGSVPDDDFSWFEIFEIVECAGCENIQFKKTLGDESMISYNSYTEQDEYSEEVVLFPTPLKKHVPLVNEYSLPPKIKAIYRETLDSFKAGSYILTGVGFRAIIEAVCIDKSIKGKDLQQKINNLLKEKLITEKECKRLHSIRFLGNDSVHEMLKPELRTLYIVLEIIEHLLRNIYLIDLNIGNHLDTIINEYSQFEELLWSKCNRLANSIEISIRSALGKDFRRVEEDCKSDFTYKLVARVENGEIDWLMMENKQPASVKIYELQKFKIIR